MSNWTNSDIEILLMDLKLEIQANIEVDREWLQTTQGDEVECISVENLEGIMNTAFANIKEKLWEQ